MPFNYAHTLLALSAAEASSAAGDFIAACPKAYRAGAMGPDPYFADAMPKPLLSKSRAGLAEQMHKTDARKLLSACFHHADSPVKRAYALGFLCHFTLDANAHAYIFARFPGAAHTPGEMHMDLPLAALLGKADVIGPPQRFFHLTKDELMEIDALHADMCRTLFDEQSRGVFARSYRKWIDLINRLAFDPGGGKRRFFGRIERWLKRPGLITGWLVTNDPSDAPLDPMNLSHKPWAAPWAADLPRRESFIDLFNAALDETPALLDAAAAGFVTGDFSEALHGVAGRCMHGSPLL